MLGHESFLFLYFPRLFRFSAVLADRSERTGRWDLFVDTFLALQDARHVDCRLVRAVVAGVLSEHDRTVGAVGGRVLDRLAVLAGAFAGRSNPGEWPAFAIVLLSVAGGAVVGR